MGAVGKVHDLKKERRRRIKAKNARLFTQTKQEFGARLTEETALFETARGSRLTHAELARILRERTKKRITPRYVGRWYRGVAMPRTDIIVELADLLDVYPGWLAYGSRTDKRPARGVFITPSGFYALDNSGKQIVDIVLHPDCAERDAVLEKCYELLELISPERPMLRVIR